MLPHQKQHLTHQRVSLCIRLPLTHLGDAYERITGRRTQLRTRVLQSEHRESHRGGLLLHAGRRSLLDRPAVAHAAQTIDWFIDGAFAPNGFDLDFEGHERKVRAVTSLSDARAWLAKSVENAQAVVASKTDEEWGQPLPDGPVMGGQPRAATFGAITDHTAHRRGALTIYARLRGKVPPMPCM